MLKLVASGRVLSPVLRSSCGRVHPRAATPVNFRASLSSDASSSPPTTTSSPPSKKLVLYERDKSRNLLPRSLLAFSTFNSVYWAWYVLDFIPAINAAPVADWHIDPSLGYFGLTLAAALNLFSTIHPKCLISRVALTENPNDKGAAQLLVTVHDLPLIRPTPFGPVYDIGECKLDPSSAEAKELLENLDNGLAQFRGHLPLKIVDHRLPYLLDIRDGAEVKQPRILLRALLDPDGYTREFRRQSPWNQSSQTSTKRRNGAGSRKRRR